MQEKRAGKMASAVQQVGLVRGIYGLFQTFVISVIIIAAAVLLFFMGAPWYIGAVMILIAAGVMVLSVAALKRTASVDLDTLNEPVPESVALEPGEVLVDTIPAVMQYFTTRSVAVLGTGKVLTPENALIITNRAIWALTVPLPGVDKVVSGSDIGSWQWMLAYNDIKEKLQEMLTTLPLEEVLKQGRAKRLMGREELKTAKTRPLSHDIRLVRHDGKTYRYSIRLKEDYLRAREIFKIH